MIQVIAIGGTGKGVVNELHFMGQLATVLGRPRPAMGYSVHDQDPGGTWPGIRCERVAKSLDGTFIEALQLDARDRPVAELLYTPKELDLPLARGFHGYPRVVASLDDPTVALPNLPSAQATIVVFSDFGGTGAGAGPRWVRQLLADRQRKYLLVVVYGKYLDVGCTPSGMDAMGRVMALDSDAGDRWFRGYYLRFPIASAEKNAIGLADHSQQVSEGASGPLDGLNQNPSLLAGAFFAWHVARKHEEGANALESFLGLSASGQPRGKWEAVIPGDPRFSSVPRFSAAADSGNAEAAFVPDLVQAIVKDDLNELLPKDESKHLNAGLRAVFSTGLGTRCAGVFTGELGSGDPNSEKTAYPAAFMESGFGSASEAWGAADCFHRALAERLEPMVQVFLKLSYLYVHDALLPEFNNWSLGDGDSRGISEEIVSLHDAGAADAPTKGGDRPKWFRSTVVGAYSRQRTFWVTPAAMQHLDDAFRRFIDSRIVASAPPIVDIVVGVAPHSRAARNLQPLLGARPLVAEGVPCRVTVSVREDMLPIGSYQWAIMLPMAERVTDVQAIARQWPLVARHLDIHGVKWGFTGLPAYVSIDGVGVNPATLLRDGEGVLAQASLEKSGVHRGVVTIRRAPGLETRALVHMKGVAAELTLVPLDTAVRLYWRNVILPLGKLGHD